MLKKIFLKLLCLIVAAIFLSACASVSDNGLGNPYENSSSFSFTSDLWHVLSYEFSLPGESPAYNAVRKQINWLMSHPVYVQKMAEQSRPYFYYIYCQVKKRGLPAELTLLPMIESAYSPFAYSAAGASGLWQMMPGTASGFGLKVDWWYDGRRDIIASTNSALNYLEYLGNYFHGDWLLALAAYDSGEGVVNAAIQKNLKAGLPTDFWDLPLPDETHRYVPKLLALATIIRYPYEYPIDLPPIPNKPYLSEINIGSQIDLERAAKMADISLQTLANLNPGFNRWATDPDGPYTLLLPIDKAAHFDEKLAELPKNERVTWMRHQVKSGDNLSSIAYEYKTTISLLKKVNRLHNNNLKLGQVILIPTQTSKLTQIVLHSEQKYLTSANSIPEIHITRHTVKKGETLLGIAKKYHVTPAQIRFWNGLHTTKNLPVGKSLILWPPQRHTFYRSATITYKVKPGDSLSSIAHHYQTTIKQLRELNHQKHNTIYVGQLLKIPYHYKFSSLHRSPKKITYQVKPGDTLSLIAKKYHVTIADIKHWNKIFNANHLKVNELIVLYK